MRKYLRSRNYYLVGGSLLVLLASFFTDPNGGALTLTWLLQLTTPIVAVWFSYLARHALFDYLDMEELLLKARESAVGSAIAFAGVCIVVFGLLGLFGASARAQDVNTYIPDKARIYMPVVKAEQYRLWPDHPKDT
jgi:hypothetical protein